MLETAQPGPNVIAGPAQQRITGKSVATELNLAEITGGLGFAPCAECAIADAEQVSLGVARKSEPSHG